MMRASEQCHALIRMHEGLRLETYADSAGVLTIGYGHTGDDVYWGKRVTEGEANELLKQDVITAERAIRHRLMVQLCQRQLDALVSLVYNLGPRQVLDPASSTLARKLAEGDKAGAAGEFMRWNRAGGRTLEGLVLRRWRECGLWLGTWEPSP